MKLIAGLGNVGDKYLFTRHNIGFMALDFFRELNDIGENFKFENKFNGHILKTNILGEPIILVKPDTFMNLSGECIRKVFDFYKLDVKDVLVVYDDISCKRHILQQHHRKLLFVTTGVMGDTDVYSAQQGVSDLCMEFMLLPCAWTWNLLFYVV